MENHEVKYTPSGDGASQAAAGDTERRQRVRRPLSHSQRVDTHVLCEEPRRHRPASRYSSAAGSYRNDPERPYQRYDRPQYTPRYERPAAGDDQNVPAYRQDRRGTTTDDREYRPLTQPRQAQDGERRPYPARPVAKKKKKKKSRRPPFVVRYEEDNVDLTQPMRLNKYLANAGVCSRREADSLIQQGLVTVNGEVVTALGERVLRTDVVTCQGKPVSLEKKVYVLLNKPKGFVTTCDDPEHRKMVVDLIRSACPERIYPVGRLDRNTTGVLLFTNDGEIAAKLTHPSYVKKKIYHAFLNREVSEADMQALLQGVELDDGPMKADAVDYVEGDRTQVGIEIHSGRNRIVRRLFEKLGYQMVKLDRVYFAGLTKKNLRRGQWRYLDPEEVNMLRMGAYE